MQILANNNIYFDEFKDHAAINILIADDDITNRLVLQGILTKQGYTVIHAENGKQAVEIFDDKNPDLVLMDVMMPVMDGYTATEAIKNRCGEQFVPIIFLTAMTDEYALAKCVACGGDDFLTKPYNYVILKARIDALLRIRLLYNTIQEQKTKIELHQHLMEREARIAESLFANIIRSSSLSRPEIKYMLSPMSLFSGDMLIAAEKPCGGLHIMLGDFTGHGLAAATGALPASSIFYEMTLKGYSITEIVMEINGKLKTILPTGMFLAACLIDLDPEKHSISVWNGGVPDVLIYGIEKQQIVNRMESIHLPLGIVDNKEFDNTVVVAKMQNGDKVYLYSDGVVEATNPQNLMFGQERLEQFLNGSIPGNKIFHNIKQALTLFRAGKEQSDDVTLAEITCDVESLAKLDSSAGDDTFIRQPASQWSISFRLNADCLRNADPLPVVIQSVTEIQGLNNQRQQLYTILAELYSNALEHGLLGLNSKLKTSAEGFAEYYQQREKNLDELEEGFILIDINHKPDGNGGEIIIRIEDSGTGFDYANNRNLDMHKNDGHSGRGLPLLNTLCESVNYLESGNIVEAVFRW